ncbi:MAG: pantetheine-phosphate adenylyltransferase [Bacteroidetes bacterium]|nr:pantetheine-phosphate adenylyltransferase [Bacteroidota bacterium]
MSKLAIYPGTFDPITNGHIDVLERACKIFDHVVVTLAINSSKQPLFTVEARKEMIREATTHLTNVSVDTIDGLLIRYASDKGAISIVRGLRQVSDFEYEFQMALMNRKIEPEISTVFLMPSDKYTFLNSTIIRELARLGANVSEFVPPSVLKRLQDNFSRS